jgi:ABC-type branched-subunit amino acid transport system substrate-binding protein
MLRVAGAAAGGLPVGIGMNDGLRAAFEEADSKGGIHSRQVRLLSGDDGYEPESCVDCTAKMIGENGVFALAGCVGTPTANVAASMAQELKVPLVGLLGGALLLREPVLRDVINMRASYDDETEALVGYLTRIPGASKIAVFYQNDSFGLAGLGGVEAALRRRGLALAAKGSFERNTLAVRSGLARVMAATPDAVIIIAPYKPTAEFVRAAKEAGLRSKFAAISFTGVENLVEDPGPSAAGIIVSQVVPSPFDTALPVSRDYQAALKSAQAAERGAKQFGNSSPAAARSDSVVRELPRSVAPDASPSYVGFEGYVTGRVLLAAIDRAGKDLTREKLIEAFDGMSKLDVGGMTFSYSASAHQDSGLVFLTVIRDGRARSVSYH